MHGRELGRRLGGLSKDLLRDLAGTEDWSRSKVGWLTGLGAMRSSVASGLRPAAQGGGGIRTLLSAAFGRRPVEPLPTDSTDPVERFEIARAVHRRTEADVASLQRSSNRLFNVSYILTVLLLCFGIVGARELYSATGSVFRTAFLFFPLPAMLALMAQASFANWQVRRRRLDGFMSWLRNPLHWMTVAEGSSATAKSSNVIGIGLLLLFAAACLGPSVAIAADETGFLATIPETDLFLKTVRMFLGGVGAVGGSEGTYYHQLSTAFGAFSGGLLAIGSMMMGWHVLAGMVATAHEGKVLGQRWHQIWAPVRVTMGVGLLAPVAGGFCAAQLLVLQILMWGAAMGNTVWYAFVDSIAFPTCSTSDSACTRPSPPPAADVVREIARLETCQATVNKGLALQGTSYSRTLVDLVGRPLAAKGTVTGKQEGKATVWDYGSACGKLTVADTSSEQTSSWLVNDGFESLSVTVSKAMTEARVKAVGAAAAKVRPLAAQIAERVMPGNDPANAALPDGAVAKEAYEAYQAEIRKGIDASVTALSTSTDKWLQNFRTEGKSLGWASAGTFYVTVTQMQGLVSRNVTLKPAPDPVDPAQALQPSAVALLEGSEDGRPGAYDVLRKVWDAGIGEVSADGTSPDPSKGRFVDTPGSRDDWWNPLAWLSEGMYPLLKSLTALNVTPDLAMIQMISHGHSMMVLGEGLLLLITLASMGMSMAAKTTAVGKGAGLLLKMVGGEAFAKIFYVLFMLVMIMIGVGIVHAIILPMIPYFMMTFFLMGMLILAAEAMVAAPIWAFFHIRLDGQDLVDQVQKPGYMIAFNLLLRIPLAVFGFMMANMVFGSMVWFVSQTFYKAAQHATAGHFSGPVTIFVLYVMITYLNYQLALRSFHLIVQVPDRVSRWFGQGGDHLGEENEAKSSTAFIVGNVTQRTERMTAGLGFRKNMPGADGKGPGGGTTGGGGGTSGGGGASGIPGASGRREE